jgi:hypothetical protein
MPEKPKNIEYKKGKEYAEGIRISNMAIPKRQIPLSPVMSSVWRRLILWFKTQKDAIANPRMSKDTPEAK